MASTSNSLININMGITVTGNLFLGRPFFPSTANMGLAFALFQAEIDKSYLTWVDVEKLRTDFPQRVSIVEDMVTLKGPVLIVPAIGSAKRIFMQVFAFASLSLIGYFVLDKLFPVGRRLRSIVLVQSAESRESQKNKPVKEHINLIAALSSPIIAGIAVYLSSRFISNRCGIHFYSWPGSSKP